MEPKTILAIVALAVGVILIFKDVVLAVLAKSVSGGSSKAAPVEGAVVKTTPISKSKTPRPSSAEVLNDLDSLVLALDRTKDSQEIDYLIDSLAPKLIRRSLEK